MKDGLWHGMEGWRDELEKRLGIAKSCLLMYPVLRVAACAGLCTRAFLVFVCVAMIMLGYRAHGKKRN